MSNEPGALAADKSLGAEEEARYRAVLSLDPDRDQATVLARMSDPSWRVRRAAVEKMAAARQPELEKLLALLSLGDEAGARNAAAEALSLIGTGAIGPLSKRLSDPDPDVRKLACDILGSIGDPAAAAALEGALKDQDDNIRAAAAEALGKLGRTEAAGALEGLLSSESRYVKLAALEALGQLGRAPPLAVLAPLARDRMLRRAVLRLLGTISGRASLELIAEGLKDPSRGTREAAFAALAEQVKRYRDRGLQGLAQAIKATSKSTSRLAERAREVLAAGNALASEGAVRVLGLVGEPADAPAVVKAGVEESVRDAALHAVAGMGASAGPALLEALPNLLPEARLLAIRALSRLRERSATPALVELARAGGEQERRLAVEALGALADPGAIPTLARLLEDRSLGAEAGRALAAIAKADRPGVQRALRGLLDGPAASEALKVLGEVGGPEDLPALKAALRSERPEVRLAAAQAATSLGEPAVEELLRLSLADEAFEVRAAAARGLGGLGSKESVPSLVQALQDAEPSVAAAAADALGSLGDRGAAPALAAAVMRGESQPGTPEVLPAIAAVRSLARLGCAVPEVLMRAVHHGDPEVVKEAVDAAAALPAAGPVLLEAARNPRWDVRRAAARAIAIAGDRSLLPELRPLVTAERDPLAAEALAEAVRALEERPAPSGR